MRNRYAYTNKSDETGNENRDETARLIDRRRFTRARQRCSLVSTVVARTCGQIGRPPTVPSSGILPAKSSHTLADATARRTIPNIILLRVKSTFRRANNVFLVIPRYHDCRNRPLTHTQAQTLFVSPAAPVNTYASAAKNYVFF